MKFSEVSASDVIAFARLEPDLPDIKHVESLYLPAARAHILGLIGISQDAADEKPDLAVAVLALCADMYENRTVAVDRTAENPTVSDIIGKYDCNFIPGGGGS